MDIFLEIFIEIYLDLAFYFFPEDKLKPWQVFLIRLVCMIIALVFIGLLLAGILILTTTNTNQTLGIVLTAVGGVLTAVQFIASTVLIIKNKR